ncbi:MAG: UDP-N-acetylmuramate--L-alanine ligase, partial [Candidatus Doudnabacteria bacterium CG10_big_fil_rev_8_21_14_0_10_42_18]
KIQSVYFVGIGGIAMSAVAAIAKQSGLKVLGSDSKEAYSPSLGVLENNKIEYFKGYETDNIKKNAADLYVISAGEDLANPEVKYIYKNDLPHAGFPEFLYVLAREKLRMVVTGTHGKSTTSAILGHLLKNIDESSFLTGAVLQEVNSNFYLGNGHYFVFEGDEYKNEFDDPTPKFQYYKPDILILTNLEYDHPDLFESFEDLKKEFELLIANLPPDSLLVYNADDANLVKLAQNTEVAKVSFAIDNEADYRAVNIEYGREYTTLDIENKFSKDLPTRALGLTEQYKIQLPGKLYAYDALAALATLRTLGFSREQILLNLLSFKGLKRRFEVIGVKNNITIIDDYAHHPTAVKATLEAARVRYPRSKIWAVFEPHTFSRTEATIKDLAIAFGSADEILISEIYPAREKSKDFSVTSQKVADAIKKHNTLYKIHNTVRKVENKNQALKLLQDEMEEGDVVIIMAVGNFNKLGYEVLNCLNQKI